MTSKTVLLLYWLVQDLGPYKVRRTRLRVAFMTSKKAPAATSPKAHPIEHLTKPECWDLLKEQVLGRLAVVVDDHPDIFPVNYVVDGETLVFRTAEGTKLYGSTSNTPVAFEIDGYLPETAKAWSIVLRGTVMQIKEPAQIQTVENLMLQPWQGGIKNHFMRVRPLNLSGRRFQVVNPDMWRTPLSDARRASFE